ncbi:ATP-binding cassette domain-containing protein [Paenibacillus sp. IB182496]|uniref:ATP-binding cassette domain-containing protein n=1 Tax=Paenibacillus sabuli TaxID=2772509 RepID=A0A927BR15_9BACL|nr:ATP-binding cassette domain-containing protein [Paenibacillus sabuli]MBD2843964.1 ATP-binding cassette domain-containing protein [Paenibacillus sabuli]
MNPVTVQNLSYRYPGQSAPVLEKVSFTLDEGEIAGITGPSGSGKSTLLRLLAGLEEPECGVIRIGGQIVADERRSVPPERRGVGMVFQDYALFPHLRVADNIAFGLHRRPRRERRDRLAQMLELTQMTALAGRYPHELSGGQQQRVALARALAPAPALLLLDEPFSSLDAELKGGLREELGRLLRQARITCLLVSHDRSDVRAICGRELALGGSAGDDDAAARRIVDSVRVCRGKAGDASQQAGRIAESSQ